LAGAPAVEKERWRRGADMFAGRNGRIRVHADAALFHFTDIFGGQRQ
jgi:hypothetical protein